MAAGSSARQRGRKAYGSVHLWLQRNELKLLTIAAVCIALLSFMHLLPSTFQVFAQENVIAIQVAAAVLVSFIALSVIGKGLVPLVICALGIVLMHNSVILPYYAEPQTREVTFWGTTIMLEEFTPTAVSVGTTMNFLLGASMVAFSIVIAYKPSLLFTRNRPESLDAEWAKYPVWHDNALLADGRMERSVPVKSLMSEQEQYLLWRYEYILASIYGRPHLVSPHGHVPEGSVLFRDKESGRVAGKARHTSFFT